jgi:hypothetical protein
MRIQFSLGVWSILFLILLILKLTGVISIGWWIVFSPLWFPVAMLLIAFLIAFLLIKKRNTKEKWF